MTMDQLVIHSIMTLSRIAVGIIAITFGFRAARKNDIPHTIVGMTVWLATMLMG